MHDITPSVPAIAVRMGPPPCNLEKELLGADKPAVVATDAHPASAQGGVTLASLLTYARHYTERASNGGEDGNEEFEYFFPVFHLCYLLFTI